eukprot:GHVN01040741.1.p1 GENE.GHVN01040741.1~~GHVN01040741.1.p1  ORF type:complete len:148 (+),score=13.46 GHVN01040741.1:470-913(+)
MGCTSSSAKTGGEDIRRTYKIGAVLGSGSFGQVRLCTRLDNGEVYAVKIMAKTPPKKSSKVDHEHMFKNEVDVLQTLSEMHNVKTVYIPISDRPFECCEVFGVFRRQTFSLRCTSERSPCWRLTGAAAPPPCVRLWKNVMEASCSHG